MAKVAVWSYEKVYLMEKDEATKVHDNRQRNLKSMRSQPVSYVYRQTDKVVVEVQRYARTCCQQEPLSQRFLS